MHDVDHHADDHEPLDAELDALLTRARPTPDPAWVRATGEQLFPAGAAGGRMRWRLRPVVIGATAGLAAVITGVALVGGGPLASNGGAPARAHQDCAVVYVTKVEPLGEVRRQADGTVEVQTVQRPVTHAERHCR